ncbi:hypothetical protein [uncultured Oscillibacter sp.]|uniref:hypothetical protein n=1 Tax=uncultured Oscillibacter sp. TaxID=876091 RepID=UPI0026370A82|nr:hypothetical protein [uncultured Oscillibacter sp.]
MDKATDTRLCEIRNYVAGTRIRGGDQSRLTSKEILALGEFTRQDFYGAILLAFSYGRAKGYQTAKAEGLVRAARRQTKTAVAVEQVNG